MYLLGESMNLFKNKRLVISFKLLSCVALGACSQLQQPSVASTSSESTPAVTIATAEGCRGADCRKPQPQDTSAPALPHTVWQRIEAGYQLGEHSKHPKAQEILDWYRQHPSYLKTISERASRYIHYITEKVEERNFPSEIALLPAVESAYDPFAYSPGRAAGLWQFIPGTAKHVGLKHSWWFDGRRDVLDSTGAALDYLASLNKRFDGDWLLTLAAYNAGGGTVSRAIRHNRRHGKPTDFWSLDLPAETRRYVPKLLALSVLISSAEESGLELTEVADGPYFRVVDTGGQIDLAQAADFAGVSIDEIYHLNPGFNRWATDPAGPHRLLVPYSRAESFQKKLAALPPEQRMNWERYAVKPGDTLITIARKYHTDIATIKATNKLNNNLIRAGQTLLLPAASRGEGHYRFSADQRLASAQDSGSGDGRSKVYHNVQSGESLWTIARQHGVRLSALSKWNNLAPGDTIRPGQQLAIWKTGAATQPSASNGRGIIRKVGYTVRSGDSLARIAGKFNVGINDIAQWNKINPAKYLKPGQYLTLYVDVTNVSQFGP